MSGSSSALYPLRRAHIEGPQRGLNHAKRRGACPPARHRVLVERRLGGRAQPRHSNTRLRDRRRADVDRLAKRRRHLEC
jgi:hypothetical protein